jgi:hypothetical protein
MLCFGLAWPQRDLAPQTRPLFCRHFATNGNALSKIHIQSGGLEYMAAGGSEWAVCGFAQLCAMRLALGVTAVFSPGSAELREARSVKQIENSHSKDRGWGSRRAGPGKG